MCCGPMVILMIFHRTLNQSNSLLVMMKFLLNLAPEPEPEPEPEMAEYQGTCVIFYGVVKLSLL